MQKKFLHRAFCVLSCAVLAAGCGKKQIKTVADGPALAMPEPPSRVFAPIEDEEPLASSAVPDASPARPPAAVNPTRPPSRPRPAETERTEQAPPAPAVAPTPEPPRELRPASSPGDQESERKIGELMRRAQQTLNNVDYRVLSTGRRENYDQAKAMITEAEKALKERNYLYAETLADKAVKLATELLGR
jgi:hypothetical protein